MGANAQTAVPVFTAGQVLTAAQVTQINTGIPVFATTTTRDAAFGGTGEKTLAQGQYAYIEATSSLQVYSGSAWIAAGQTPGLVRVGGGTLSGSSTTFSSVFSATYAAYKIVLTDLSATATSQLTFKLGATATGYYYSSQASLFSTGGYSIQTGAANDVVWAAGGNLSSTTGAAHMELLNPFLSTRSVFTASFLSVAGGTAGTSAGYLDNSTSYTAFTVAPASGNLTGTVNIYGYALS